MFVVDEQTLLSWMRRRDESGDTGLLQTAAPVNRFPDLVRHLVQQLRILVPSMGKVRIAQVLARGGLHLGATTVGRILRQRQDPPRDHPVQESDRDSIRVVTAKQPHEVWHLDLTTIPTAAGFWVSWVPHSWIQRWPFCWWLAEVLDHFSRWIVGFAVFEKQPTAAEVVALVRKAATRSQGMPKSLVTDRGRQFVARAFGQWCRRRGIRQRFGAVGQAGSIAVVERFLRSLKVECARRIQIPFRSSLLRRELSLYGTWYNQHRPSQALEGRTPREVCEGVRPRNTRPRFELREKWPSTSPCAGPPARLRKAHAGKLSLCLGYLEGRKHLPILELRRAA